jgi:tetratricopeptide (TPR) repeat protein
MPPSAADRHTRPGLAQRPARIWWGTVPFLVTVLTGLLLSWHSLSDLDIWFHLRSGRDLLDGQGISQVNKYSFTEPDHPWVNHEWLFQVLAAVIGPTPSSSATVDPEPDVSGWNLLRASLTLLLLLTVLLGDGGRARFLGRDGPTAAAWAALPVLAGLMLLWPRLSMRPELFSYVFFVFLVRWSEQFFRMSPGNASRTPGNSEYPAKAWAELWDPRRTGGRLFLLTVIWAQLHGFAALAPLMILLGAPVALLQNRWFRQSGPSLHGLGSWKRTVGLMTLLVIALLLTPNGLGGLMMPVRAVGQFFQDKADLRTTISELVPLQKSPNSLGLTIAVYRVSLVWAVVWIFATAGRVSLLRIVLFVLAALGAWTHQRTIGFYALSFMLLHTGAGSQPWQLSWPRSWSTPPPHLRAAAGWALTLLAAAIFWPYLIGDDFYLAEGVGRRFGAGLTPAHFPAESARAMARLDDPRYFANLDATGFLLANSTGRCFIDGRTEAFSPDLWAEYLDIKRADDDALNLLAKRQVQALCLATAGSSFHPLAIVLLGSDHWNLVTAESGGLLFRPLAASINGSNHPGQENRNILTRAANKTLAAADNGSPTRRADLCLTAGQLFMFARETAHREAAYRRGLSYKSDHPALNHNLGNLLLDQQNFQEALPYFQNALRKNPRLAGSALNQGVCQMRLGQLNEAIGSFRLAVARDPARFEGWVNLAMAQFRNGNRPDAIRNLEKGLKLRPQDQRLRQLLREWKNGARN